MALSVVPAAWPQLTLVGVAEAGHVAPSTPVFEKLLETQTVAEPPENRP